MIYPQCAGLDSSCKQGRRISYLTFPVQHTCAVAFLNYQSQIVANTQLFLEQTFFPDCKISQVKDDYMYMGMIVTSVRELIRQGCILVSLT